jgi:hypothetical protein
MPVFPVLELEKIVQTFDKTRLDATKSFKSDDIGAVTKVEIQPDGLAAFIEVATADPTDSEKYYLDWLYSSAGTKTVTLKITTGTGMSAVETSSTMDIEAVLAADENLFSKDTDLTGHQKDILKYVSPGRSSFINVHRSAQELILDDLYKTGVTTINGERLNPEDIMDIAEVRQWSKFMVLQMIYEDISNAKDDVFAEKAKSYKASANEWRSLSLGKIKVDKNQDGEVTEDEVEELIVGRISRA